MLLRRAAEVIFNHFQLVWGARRLFSRPPLLHPYPYPQPLLHNHRLNDRDRAWTGRPCHPHALRRRHGYHSAAAWAVRRGARPWLERRRLILQPIQPPPTLGTMPNTPYLALTLELLHVSLRTWTGVALAADAIQRTTLNRRADREKAAATSAQLRRPMQAN